MSNTPPPITVEDTATGEGPLPSPEMEGVNGEYNASGKSREDERRGERDVVKRATIAWIMVPIGAWKRPGWRCAGRCRACWLSGSLADIQNSPSSLYHVYALLPRTRTVTFTAPRTSERHVWPPSQAQSESRMAATMDKGELVTGPGAAHRLCRKGTLSGGQTEDCGTGVL